MSDPPPPPPSERHTEEGSVTITDPRQRGLDLPLPPALQSLVDLEKQRIDSFNRRTDVVRFAIETNDAADRRQYEYQMAKLQAESDDSKRRHSLVRLLTIGGGVVLTATAGALLGMAFFGDANQSAIALSILKVLGTGTAGYGLITALIGFVRRMANEGQIR